MYDYKERLEKIEDALFQCMPEKSTRLWIEKAAGNRSGDLKEQTADVFNAPGLELLGRGGKRWRPLIMILVGEAAGGSRELYNLIPLVELPHNGSLIVDDIEDKSNERRGGKSIHLIYGDDISINGGNLMYFLPTYLIDEGPYDPLTKYRLYRAYSRALRRLHFGQGMDIQWHNDHDYIPSEQEYLQMTRFKTGCLSSLAARLAIIEAGGSRDLEERAGDIWEDIGVGFQILDDVMNLKKGNPGKMRGDDIVEGKKSLPLILHCGRTPDSIPEIKDLFAIALRRNGTEVEKAVSRAIALMEESGAVDVAGAKGLELLEMSKKALNELFPESGSTAMMIDVVDGFIEKML